MTAKRILNQEQIDDMINLYKVNIKVKKLGRKYKCSVGVISRILTENRIIRPQHEYVLEGGQLMCLKCETVKPLSAFNTTKSSKIGYRSQCKECTKIYLDNNNETIKEKRKEYYEQNKDIISVKGKEYRSNPIVIERNIKYQKEYRINNEDQLREQKKQYTADPKNKEHKREYDKIHNPYRYKNNTTYRITKLLRGRVRNAIKDNIKSASTMELLGCTVEELKIHLQKTADDNYPDKNFDINNYDSKLWHIDHIKPCSKFNMEDPEEQKKCFHYTNLQILTAEDNLKKYNK